MNREYSKQSAKFLDSQNEDVYSRITSAISKLPKGDVKKLKGTKNKYRLRVGDFRIIFAKTGNFIFIENIDNRGQVYK